MVQIFSVFYREQVCPEALHPSQLFSFTITRQGLNLKCSEHVSHVVGNLSTSCKVSSQSLLSILSILLPAETIISKMPQVPPPLSANSLPQAHWVLLGFPFLSFWSWGL